MESTIGIFKIVTLGMYTWNNAYTDTFKSGNFFVNEHWTLQAFSLFEFHNNYILQIVGLRYL
jgi:hypothetical protein